MERHGKNLGYECFAPGVRLCLLPLHEHGLKTQVPAEPCEENLDWQRDHAMFLRSYTSMLIWRENFSRSIGNSTTHGRGAALSEEIQGSLVEVLVGIIKELDGVDPELLQDCKLK
jgi:hypothetical protein